MIGVALEFKKNFDQYSCFDMNFISSFEDEWDNLKVIYEFLAPFYELTEMFSNTNYPTNVFFI